MISFLNSAPFPTSSPLSDLKRTKPLSCKDLVGAQVFSSLAEGVFPPPAHQSYLIIRLRLPTPPGAVAAVLLLETVFVARAAYRL